MKEPLRYNMFGVPIYKTDEELERRDVECALIKSAAGYIQEDEIRIGYHTFDVGDLVFSFQECDCIRESLAQDLELPKPDIYKLFRYYAGMMLP